MNKIEEMLSENHGLHTSYSVKNKDGEFESVVSVKSAAEITEQIAIEFAHYYFKETFNETLYSELRTTEQIFQEFLKNKTMKNVHVLPTDKPSRLFKDNSQALNLHTHPVMKGIFTNGIGSNQHIYISSEEDIREGDWIIDLDSKRIVKANSLRVATSKASQCWYYKKIILTTDQDLIKDGVQAIDDEFLDWFVKNPSCEEVKIESWQIKGEWKLDYEIIIPSEEPKQETLEEAAEKLAMDKLKSKWEHLYIFGYPQKPFPTNYENDLNNVKVGLYEGATWQGQRRYSETEVLQLLLKLQQTESYDNLYDWFEQVKKK